MKDLLQNPGNRKHLFRRKSDVVFIYAFTVVLYIASGIMSPTFFSPQNMVNILTIWLPLMLASYAQTMVVISGGIDLSIGSVISLSSVLCATLMEPLGWLLPVLIALALGGLVGVINGVLVTKAKQQPMIVTLATQTIFAGAALFVLNKPGGKVHAGFAKVLFYGLNKMMPLLILAVGTALVWLLLNRTPYGRSVFAVGDNENAALTTGIAVDRVKIMTYVFSGLVAALCGVLLSALMRSGDPLVGVPYTMRTITTVVVGGTSFAGGKGGIVGTFAGVLIIAIVNNILNLMGVPSFYQFVVQGGILILALTVSALRARR